jgi:hypothetical protein
MRAIDLRHPLLDNFIGCGSDSPTTRYGEAFLEYGTIARRVHMMSGQREVLPDRAEP